MTRPAVPASWGPLLARLGGGVTLVAGRQGSGKSTLARHLVAQLHRPLGRAALIAADPGQPAVGVPTCLGLALTGPWEAPAGLWFVGDTSPRGRLLPLVVGVSRLVAAARAAGAGAAVVDCCGLVAGAVGRALHAHLAAVTGARRAIIVAPPGELEDLAAALAAAGAQVLRVPPSPLAADRSPAERRAAREARLRAHFALGADLELPADLPLLGTDWARIEPDARDDLPRGALVGLLGADGACLALGRLLAASRHGTTVATPWRDAGAVAGAQLARLVLDDDLSELPATDR